MHDLRRYVPLMELKCVKRHVKSGSLYRLDNAARFYRASKREGLHAAAFTIRGVEYVSQESTSKWLRGAYAMLETRLVAPTLSTSSFSFSFLFFSFCQNRDQRTSSYYNTAAPQKNASTDLFEIIGDLSGFL